MVRNQKLALLGGGVMAGAAVLAMAAEALLWSPLHAPTAAVTDTLPTVWVIRGGGEGTVVLRQSILEDPDAAGWRHRGPLGAETLTGTLR